MAQHLAAADVAAMNEAILRQAGEGIYHLRDEGALESAVMRPQMSEHYEDADIVSQAATLIAGIALAHAFLDGNKRTAATAGAVFLYLNGWEIDSLSPEFGQQVEALVNRSGSLREALAAFTEWLRARVIARHEV